VAESDDNDPSSQLAEVLDRSLHYLLSRVTLGVSPMGFSEAYFDWLVHLMLSPGKQLQLWQKGFRKAAHLTARLCRCAAKPSLAGSPCISPLPQDKRFNAAAWQQWPFNAIHQGFLLQQQWWHNATTGIRGVTPHHERVLGFACQQMLDVVAPSQLHPTNPEILAKTRSEGGRNLVQGWINLLEDWERAAIVVTARVNSSCTMVNRNAGSSTRILIDRLLAGDRPAGYRSRPNSHNAVATAVAQGCADWGLTIKTAARRYNLGFIPVQDEQYDFVVPKSRVLPVAARSA
jgi:hypothetical protein